MNSIDIKKIASSAREQVKKDVINLKLQGINPHLNVILAGENDSAIVYANTKKRIGESLGIKVSVNTFSNQSNETDIMNLLLEKNNDPETHGIIIESPVPKNMNYDSLINSISPLKDVDGLHANNLGMILARNSNGILPATPLACIRILNEIFQDIKGLRITIVGHGKTVGGPLSNMLSNMGATVVSCNHYTKDLKSECLGADVIISATGVHGLIKADMVHKNTVIIDAGISLNETGNIVGDVDFVSVNKIARYTTPVPGGVGPITTSLVFNNLIKGIYLQQEKYNPFGISLDDFISLSKGPGMPGGGGISSMTAINSVSMLSMVYSLTKGIERSSHEGIIDKIITELKSSYLEDIGSFKKYLSSLKLPRDTDEEKIERSKAIKESLMESCLVPIKIGNLCLEILAIAKHCYQIGNKNVLTDVIVGVNLAIAAAKSALEPIELNLQGIDDIEFKTIILKEKQSILLKLNSFNLKD